MAERTEPHESEDINKKVKAWLTSARDEDNNAVEGNWISSLTPHLTLAHPIPPKHRSSITFNFTIQSEHCNRMHSLHGGCISSLFDFTTTLALLLVSRPGFWESMGVSRCLNVTYLRPAPEGTELLIECEVTHVGKSLAALKGTMRRKSDGKITATCEHTKVNVDKRPRL